MSRATVPACCLLIALALISCSKSAEQYLSNGNRYLEKKQYREAIVEYRNAIQKNANLGEARYKLAEAYAATNDPRNAYREYIRAADLLPGNFDAQLKAANFLLLAGQFEDAKARAQKALKLNPKSVDAQILMGNATAGLKDLDTAIAEVQEAIQMAPETGRAYTALGTFQAAKGNKDEAERAFRRSVELTPTSVDARLALGGFYWNTGRPADAEQAFKEALQADPASPLANRALATFCLASNRAPEAEQYLVALAKTKQPAASLMLADYYAMMGRPDDAIRAAQSVAGQKEWFARARSKVAAIEYGRGHTAEGHKAIDEVLVREPKNAEALLVKARFLLAENKLDEALARAQAAVAADQRSASAYYVVGALQSRKQNTEEAIKAFNEVLKLNPRAVAAQMELSRLQLMAGATEPALRLAEDAVKLEPGNPAARLTLARSLTARGELAQAESELKDVLAKHPSAAPAHAQLGTVLALKKDAAGARKAFDRAFQIDSNSYEALVGLTTLDMNAGKPADARARVESQLVKSPDSGPLLVLAARVYGATGDVPRAEQTLQHAIQIDPANLRAYGMLVQIYLSQRKLDQARDRLEEMAKRQPKPVGPQTMIGMILQAQNRNAEAQKRYERVLEIDPRAAVAANNLAWLYAEGGGNLDVALQLARTAKEQLPESPEVNDTLGWVYCRKELAAMAISPLSQAIEKAPDNPSYHYHLGMALLKNNDWPGARKSLEQALKLNPTFDGAAEARTALASIKQ